MRRFRNSRRFGWRKLLLVVLFLVVGLPALLLLIYRFVPPPGTPLMVIRLFEGEGLEKQWVPLEEISVHVPRAVIAAEDNNFCQHSGFDWGAIETAITDYKEGSRLRGASTISMQTAKNIFLWPGRSFIRKGIEAYLTGLLELLWSKSRTMEVYLNVAEWSSGVYGIEAAAQHHFGKSAKQLTQWEAALLASVLPNPRQRSAARPTARVQRQARTITKRIGQLGPLLDCI